MVEQDRQAGILITDEMLRIGAEELVLGFDPDGDTYAPIGPYSARHIAKTIFTKCLPSIAL